MLSAVCYLHENGIVHRDIKLENFLFADNSQDSRLILIDFGLSKYIDDGEQLNQVVGSCYYTAPEVLNRCYDYKCDVWSIGVICYILLLSKNFIIIITINSSFLNSLLIFFVCHLQNLLHLMANL